MANNVGTGNGIYVNLSNVNGTGHGVNISHAGNGNGINVFASKGTAAYFYNNQASNSSTILYTSSSGMGHVADFYCQNSTTTTATVNIANMGLGACLNINNMNANAVSSLATFRKNGTSRARIDGTGKGLWKMQSLTSSSPTYNSAME